MLASVTVVTGNEVVNTATLELPFGKEGVLLVAALAGDVVGKFVEGIEVGGIAEGITLEAAAGLVELDGLEPEAIEDVLQSILGSLRGRSR